MKYQSKLNAGIDSDLELKVKLEIVETQEIFCKLHWEPSGQQCKKSLQQTALFKGQHPYSGNGWLSIAVVLNLFVKYYPKILLKFLQELENSGLKLLNYPVKIQKIDFKLQTKSSSLFQITLSKLQITQTGWITPG